ncbi:hypothetical protein ACFL1H_05060 [Nanoarchaeota archaeon]
MTNGYHAYLEDEGSVLNIITDKEYICRAKEGIKMFHNLGDFSSDIDIRDLADKTLEEIQKIGKCNIDYLISPIEFKNININENEFYVVFEHQCVSVYIPDYVRSLDKNPSVGYMNLCKGLIDVLRSD